MELISGRRKWEKEFNSFKQSAANFFLSTSPL
jgi:hypothetical protein